MLPWETGKVLTELNMVQIVSSYLKGYGHEKEHKKAKARIYELRDKLDELLLDSGYVARKTFYDIPKFDTFDNVNRVWQYHIEKGV